MSYLLERQQRVHRPRSEVFCFFSDAKNLSRLTPPELGFSILTPIPIEMKPGAIIDYRIRLWGVPFRWRTLIESFEPESRFVDIQAKGPYKLWRHTHEFIDEGDATLIKDRIEYDLPFGPLGRLVRAAIVGRQLDRIFDYRHHVVEEMFR